MIFVQGWIKLNSSNMAKIEPIAKMMVEETVKEEGCLHYSFSKDIADDSIVRVAERWQTEQRLTAHFATEHMAKFNAEFSSLDVEGMDIRLYSGEEVKVMMQS